MKANELFDVTDRVVLVTGGSRGLGAAMSTALAQRGARVVVAPSARVAGGLVSAVARRSAAPPRSAS